MFVMQRAGESKPSFTPAGTALTASGLVNGEAIGSPDLDLGIAAAPLASGRIEADNHGSRFTGEGWVTTQLNLASAFGRGESLSARLTESFSGLTAGTFHASLPLGSDGLRLGLSYADTRYTLGRDFAALGASGTAQSAGVSLSYPWVRSQRQNLSSTLSVENRRLADRIASTGSDIPKRTNSVALSLNGDLRDPLVANSVFAWNATVLSGRRETRASWRRWSCATRSRTGAVQRPGWCCSSTSATRRSAGTRSWLAATAAAGESAGARTGLTDTDSRWRGFQA